MKPRTWYRLYLWLGIGMLLTVVSSYYVDPHKWFLGSEVSKATAGIVFFWFARNAKKKLKD
ncbi:MAG TPA: hypothetical protein VHY84_14685 [Bryobacteraceae bacterium]|nr:hypothetical protein [Bryobacteraceae bacterium]